MLFSTIAALRWGYCFFRIVFGQVVIAAFYAVGCIAAVEWGVTETLIGEALDRPRRFVHLYSNWNVEDGFEIKDLLASGVFWEGNHLNWEIASFLFKPSDEFRVKNNSGEFVFNGFFWKKTWDTTKYDFQLSSLSEGEGIKCDV